MVIVAKEELRRFLLSQYHEFMRLGHPRLCTFAKNIAQGTLAPAAPTGDDPVMNAVARWYHGQRQFDRLTLARHYLPGGGTVAQQVKACGLSRERFFKRIDALLGLCAKFLREEHLDMPAPAQRAACG